MNTLKKFYPAAGKSDRAPSLLRAETFSLFSAGRTTAMQRTQWQSSNHADPMEDSPFTMAALLLVMALTVVMAGLVIGGVL